MKKIPVAVFTKISGNVTSCVEKSFYKAVFLHLSNYFENAVYGTVIDLPDSPCYKSYGDREITEAASRCYGSLPKEYRDSFFVMVRARRYNVKHSKNALSPIAVTLSPLGETCGIMISSRVQSPMPLT